jgi:DnaJ family protein C protein 11
VVTAKLDVGAVVSLSGKVQYMYRDDLHVRLAARVGTGGIDCEAGLFRRWSPFSSGYMGTLVGLQGVAVKFRCGAAACSPPPGTG